MLIMVWVIKLLIYEKSSFTGRNTLSPIDKYKVLHMKYEMKQNQSLYSRRLTIGGIDLIYVKQLYLSISLSLHLVVSIIETMNNLCLNHVWFTCRSEGKILLSATNDSMIRTFDLLWIKHYCKLSNQKVHVECL